ncbi:hypothetical protein AAU57_12455 [Nonlabens sp. YIK11]|uniref:polysaccharide biosynthesis/export family protein n=1 Tax=Nonlabens sp. YIK11 TaxID=1453349 RepID=UPI0007083F26|nr:polysaccharide biosynthesis/export family protein [Nonlabens sp. YIK11]KQC34051.1 hypothetical protein AAU57_12455 [Nonlabens sp. YIK11]
MLRKSFLLISSAFLLILTGCSSKKDILYFQDISSKEIFTPPTYTSIIKNNDQLSIIVSSADMTTVSRYNRLVPSVNDGEFRQLNGQPQLLNYLVDNKGTIDLPELGQIKVAGMTRFELEKMLTEEYKKFAKDVLVTVRLTNFKITVLGEVSRPGTYSIPDERVTLPQALGLAGDLTLYGKRTDIQLLRDNNGVQESYIIDLTKTNVLDSDLYYLQQNDVLYVGPNNAQVSGSSFNRNNPLYVSIASLILSVIILIAR